MRTIRMPTKTTLPRLPVEIAELAVLRYDLFGVDFRVVREHILPPLLLIELLKV